MSVEIIKDGVKKFRITCPNCGCEFTYENEDVCNSVVICPCCSKSLPHKGVIGTLNTNSSPIPIWYNPQGLPDGYKIRGGLNQSDNPCDNCPNNPKYLKTPYVGDSPCQFCAKNPNKITCTSGGSNV